AATMASRCCRFSMAAGFAGSTARLNLASIVLLASAARFRRSCRVGSLKLLMDDDSCSWVWGRNPREGSHKPSVIAGLSRRSRQSSFRNRAPRHEPLECVAAALIRLGWLRGSVDGSVLDLEVFRRGLAAVRHFLVFDHLAFVESREAGPLHR